MCLARATRLTALPYTTARRRVPVAEVEAALDAVLAPVDAHELKRRRLGTVRGGGCGG